MEIARDAAERHGGGAVWDGSGARPRTEVVAAVHRADSARSGLPCRHDGEGGTHIGRVSPGVSAVSEKGETVRASASSLTSRPISLAASVEATTVQGGGSGTQERGDRTSRSVHEAIRRFMKGGDAAESGGALVGSLSQGPSSRKGLDARGHSMRSGGEAHHQVAATTARSLHIKRREGDLRNPASHHARGGAALSMPRIDEASATGGWEESGGHRHSTGGAFGEHALTGGVSSLASCDRGRYGETRAPAREDSAGREVTAAFVDAGVCEELVGGLEDRNEEYAGASTKSVLSRDVEEERVSHGQYMPIGNPATGPGVSRTKREDEVIVRFNHNGKTEDVRGARGAQEEIAEVGYEGPGSRSASYREMAGSEAGHNRQSHDIRDAIGSSANSAGDSRKERLMDLCSPMARLPPSPHIGVVQSPLSLAALT